MESAKPTPPPMQDVVFFPSMQHLTAAPACDSTLEVLSDAKQKLKISLVMLAVPQVDMMYPL